MLKEFGCFDLIVGADVVYVEEAVPLLLTSIAALLKREPLVRFVIPITEHALSDTPMQHRTLEVATWAARCRQLRRTFYRQPPLAREQVWSCSCRGSVAHISNLLITVTGMPASCGKAINQCMHAEWPCVLCAAEVAASLPMRISVGLHGALIIICLILTSMAWQLPITEYALADAHTGLHSEAVAKDTGRSGEHLKDDVSLARDSMDLIVQRSCDNPVC